MTIVDIFRAGGVLMYPLAFASLITVAIIIERLINLRESRILNDQVVFRVSALVEANQLVKAASFCKQNPSIYTKIVMAGLESVEKGEMQTKEAIEDAGRHETAHLKRYLNGLGTIAAVAPLIGLLGTVIGMILVFRTIAESGGGQAAALSNGIFQALITTATGLLVAIPALLAHNSFQERADTIIQGLERASLRLVHHLFHGEHDEHAVSK